MENHHQAILTEPSQDTREPSEPAIPYSKAISLDKSSNRSPKYNRAPKKLNKDLMQMDVLKNNIYLKVLQNKNLNNNST